MTIRREEGPPWHCHIIDPFVIFCWRETVVMGRWCGRAAGGTAAGQTGCVVKQILFRCVLFVCAVVRLAGAAPLHTAIGKSTPVHVLLEYCALFHSRDEFDLYNEPRDQLVSLTKKRERERAHQHGNHGRRRPWPLASPMPRPHVFRLDKFIRHILGDAVCAWFGRK